MAAERNGNAQYIGLDGYMKGLQGIRKACTHGRRYGQGGGMTRLWHGGNGVIFSRDSLSGGTPPHPHGMGPKKRDSLLYGYRRCLYEMKSIPWLNYIIDNIAEKKEWQEILTRKEYIRIFEI